MSLTVSVFVRDRSGAMVLDEALDAPLAAGFENWRTRVWGSSQVRALGAKYFPRLAETDLHAVLATLEQERPELCVVDSVQTLHSDELTSAAGSGTALEGVLWH